MVCHRTCRLDRVGPTEGGLLQILRAPYPFEVTSVNSMELHQPFLSFAAPQRLGTEHGTNKVLAPVLRHHGAFIAIDWYYRRSHSLQFHGGGDVRAAGGRWFF